MSKVLTVGTFDLYHAGHVNFLFQCAKIAGITGKNFWGESKHDDKHNVTVGLNSDEFVEKYKGKKPVYSYDERYKLLVNNRYVWSVTKNDRPTIEDILFNRNGTSEYDFLVVGSDWAKKDYHAQIGVTQERLDQRGITLVYVPYTEGVSTTELKERILKS